MKSLRKSIAYLLVLTLPLSAWAGGGPCTQNFSSKSGAEAVIVDAHAHHGADQTSNNESTGLSNGHPAHHAAADANTDAGQAECSCCDDCESACVLSSCSPVALTTPSGLIDFSGADKHLPSADAFRNGPPPHVLFRPPIVSV